MSSTQPVAHAFSETLRTATLPAHQAAERAPFIMALMTGALDLEAYADYLAQLYRVYSALEDSVELVADDPIVSPFLDERLHRRAAIESDLEAMIGPRWRVVLPDAVPATSAYVQHIWTATQEWPSAYVAHHYTRYLGDLSGGQIIARMLTTHYTLREEELGMYRFELKAPPFKAAYRELLDQAPWDDDERARMVEEANTAYAFNQAIFDELGDRER